MWVYIIYSEVKDKYYTGITKDLNNRLKEHNQGKTRATKSGVPWRLEWCREVHDRGEACNLERKIKKRGAYRYLKDKD